MLSRNSRNLNDTRKQITVQKRDAARGIMSHRFVKSIRWGSCTNQTDNFVNSSVLN